LNILLLQVAALVEVELALQVQVVEELVGSEQGLDLL
jgi:hypothetical protein